MCVRERDREKDREREIERGVERERGREGDSDVWMERLQFAYAYDEL